MDPMKGQNHALRKSVLKVVAGNVLTNLDVWSCILSVMEEKEVVKMEVMKMMQLVQTIYVITLDVGSAQGSLNVFIHGLYAMEKPTVRQEEMKVHIYVPKNFVKVLSLDVLRGVGNVQTKQSV